MRRLRAEIWPATSGCPLPSPNWAAAAAEDARILKSCPRTRPGRLLSDRCLRRRAGPLRTGTGAVRRGASHRSILSGWSAQSGLPHAAPASRCWCCSSAAPSATSSAQPRQDFLREVRGCLRARRRAAAGRRPGQAPARMLLRLRRSRRRHRRLQPEPAGAHQSRTRTAISISAIRARSPLERAPASHRNASAVTRRAARLHPRGWTSRATCATTKPSGPNPATSSTPKRSATWPPQPAFECRAQWIDDEWPFAESLSDRVSAVVEFRDASYRIGARDNSRRA